jgi:hypothetical protein
MHTPSRKEPIKHPFSSSSSFSCSSSEISNLRSEIPSGSWFQCMILESLRLSMNRELTISRPLRISRQRFGGRLPGLRGIPHFCVPSITDGSRSQRMRHSLGMPSMNRSSRAESLQCDSLGHRTAKPQVTGDVWSFFEVWSLKFSSHCLSNQFAPIFCPDLSVNTLSSSALSSSSC